MLSAARAGNWDHVVKLEGACVLLISRLKNAAQEPAAQARAETETETETETEVEAEAALLRNRVRDPARQVTQDTARAKSRIMQRILVNDAEIRHLAEPWLQDLDDTLAGRRKTLH